MHSTSKKELAKQNEDISFKKVVAEKLTDTFQPGKKGLGELVSKITKEK